MRPLFRIIRRFLTEWKLLLGAAISTVLQCFAQLLLPRIMAMVVDDGVLAENLENIQRYGIQMLILCLIVGISGYLAQLLSVIGSQRFAKSTRQTLYEKVLTLSVQDISETGRDSLITRLTTDADICAGLMNVFLRVLLEPLLLLVGGLVLVWRIERRIGFVFLIIVVVQMGLMLLFIRSTAPLFLRIRQVTDRFNQRLQDVLARLRLIKILTQEARELDGCEELNAELCGAEMRARKYAALFHPLMMLLVDLSVAAILLISGFLAADGRVHAGTILEALAYVQQILLSLLISGQLFRSVTETEPSARRIMQVLDKEPGVLDGGRDISGRVTRLEMKDVRFRYPGTGLVLEDASISVNGGDFIAVTGAVGSGKSTVAGLLARLYDVQAGAVRVNDADLREFKLRDVHRHIALIDKRSGVVDGSLLENIQFGREYVTDRDVQKAAEAAQCAELVASLPDGWHTHVLAMGRSLSGGELQRVMIARALAGSPDVLLLDDCTSSLDYLTEDRLIDSIRNNYPSMAVVLFTQRLFSTEKADRVLRLERGRLV